MADSTFIAVPSSLFVGVAIMPNPLRRAFLTVLSLSAAIPRLLGVELDPIGPGPFAVGSTNLEVSAPFGHPMGDFLNGKRTPESTIYVADLLTHPESAFSLQVAIPVDRKTYGNAAGTHIPLVLYVLYPTTKDNPLADYPFPYTETGDNVFPHMQHAGEAPVFADAAARYPLILYSGGYNTHGLWHLSHLKWLAQHGYIVVDIFHGDNRWDFASSMAVRPVELRSALDFVLQHTDFARAIDLDRIGASSASAGAHTILCAMGGIDPASPNPSLVDPRIKAGFGLVPFMGGSFGFRPFKLDAWYFGEDHAGLRTVRVPFLALYGEKDSNVLPAGVEAGVQAMAGPASAVMLDGETHDLSNGTTSDVNTWELLFFDSWLRGDPQARQLLETGTSVRGGVRNHRTIQHGARTKS
jgi:hypothetical protein